jgi:hypothetical protein
MENAELASDRLNPVGFEGLESSDFPTGLVAHPLLYSAAWQLDPHSGKFVGTTGVHRSRGQNGFDALTEPAFDGSEFLIDDPLVSPLV